ncbi:MAG: hypothetical protein KatS3mg108_3301 [Isosphaeraceae bacterium]|jgi:Ca-activated chloride channel family protein|nr:MAG: hypothetical protein KatS3mg108_3301 [Isosphaeraceae bacterium]
MPAWPIRLAEPAWLILTPLTLAPWWLGRPALTWPALGSDGFGRRNPTTWLRANLPALLRLLAAWLVLLALSRPQRPLGSHIERSSGLALVLTLDRSASMSRPHPDSSGPTPLQTAIRVLDDFVARRPHDLIGLVAFANWPDTLCPPTLDHAVLRLALRSVTPATRAEDGTNLGDAIAWASHLALATPASRRVLILVTDGRHQPDRSSVPNPLDPLAAASLARELGLIVHTIGVQTPDADLDQPLLAALAAAGGGQFLLAESPEQLSPVLQALDQLEPSPLTALIQTRYQELWPIPLSAALACLVLAWLAARLGALP